MSDLERLQAAVEFIQNKLSLWHYDNDNAPWLEKRLEEIEAEIECLKKENPQK